MYAFVNPSCKIHISQHCLLPLNFSFFLSPFIGGASSVFSWFLPLQLQYVYRFFSQVTLNNSATMTEKLEGLSKHFNSATIRGRSNVAMATIGTLVLGVLAYKVKNWGGGKESKDKD